MLRPRIHHAVAAATVFGIAACGGSKDHTTAQQPVASAAPAPAATTTPETTTAPTVPTNVSYETADSAFRARQYGTAADMFDAYTKRRPRNSWGFYMLGLSSWKAGESAPAIAPAPANGSPSPYRRRRRVR